MYEVTCEQCGRVGYHPSRIGAESRAETHTEATGHGCSVETMETI